MRSWTGQRSDQEPCVKYLNTVRKTRIVVLRVHSNLQHAVWLVPVQFMLNIHCGFGLNNKADQAQEQEPRCHDVFFPGQVFLFQVRRPAAKRRPARVGWSRRLARQRVGECIRVPASAILLQQRLVRMPFLRGVIWRTERHGFGVVVVVVVPVVGVVILVFQ